MHRIDGPGATPDNRFTEGDPASSLPATVVTDDWLNDVQEELLSILADRGIAPVKGTQNQVLAAIKAIAQAYAAIQQATTSVMGGGKTATADDAYAGSSTTLLMTPAAFKGAQATEAYRGVARVGTQAEVLEGASDALIVTPKKLAAKLSGALSGQYPITPGSQAVFNHNLGAVPFLVEFSYVCLTAEGGWSAGDVLHRGNWYQNSVSTDGSPGIFWFGETSTQVTFGLGSTTTFLPNKTTGLRFAATVANWRFVARVIG